MNEYEVVKRKLKLNNVEYHRGDKLMLHEEVYMSHQDSLRLLEKIIKKKKSKRVKSDETNN